MEVAVEPLVEVRVVWDEAFVETFVKAVKSFVESSVDVLVIMIV